MTPAPQAPTPGDRDRALVLRRRLTTTVGIGGTAAVGAFIALASAGGVGAETASTGGTSSTTPAATAGQGVTAPSSAATAAATAPPTLAPASSAVSSAASGSAHAVSGGSGR